MKKPYIKPQTINLTARLGIDIAANDINTGSHIDQRIGDTDNDDGTYTGLTKELEEDILSSEQNAQWGSLW